MRTRQYTRQERAIAAADVGGIRERWLYGLRVLRDPSAVSAGGGLKHGVTEQLIAAAAKAGVKLSDRPRDSVPDSVRQGVPDRGPNRNGKFQFRDLDGPSHGGFSAL